MEGRRVVKGTIKWLYLGRDPDYHADFPIGSTAITQLIINGFRLKFEIGYAMIQGAID